MGLFDIWKKKKNRKAVIKTEDKDKTEVGKKVATAAKTAVQKHEEALAEALKGL